MSRGASQTSNPVHPTEIVDALCSHLAEAIKADRSLATGDAGFEGLIARLLADLTGQSFYVAASGPQPFGDAVASTGAVSLQSKAYLGRMQPALVSILGDFEVQLHSNEDLDVLVVALRSLPAQLAVDLERAVGSHGVELVCLQCTAENPDLICLLAKYWGHVHDHPLVQGIPSQLQRQISGLANSIPSKVDEVIDSLANRVLHGLWTYCSGQVASQAYLRGRFEIGATPQRRELFPICLSQAIPRADSAKGFRNWWESNQSLLFVHGEEGCGKSWLIAQEAWQIAESGDAMVLWLDSFQWAAVSNLRDVVETALCSCLGVPASDPELARRLYRKIESRWTRPILLVLDGMNERNCTSTAERILGSCFGRSTPFGADEGNGSAKDEARRDPDGWRVPKVLRIAFTTRSRPSDLIALTAGESSLFRVPPYSDNEFKKLLVDNHLVEEELPKDTAGLLRFPRFFSVFLRVKTKIGSGEVITPALIWWHDLIAKVEDGLDPAITKGLRVQSPTDAEELLTSIAEALSTENELNQSQLNDLFDGHYLDIREQLLDSRVFSKSGRRVATISDDHISLAWGLIILRFLETTQEHEPWAIADQIHQLLEPGLSDPRRAHGILVALQLSLTNGASLSDPSLGGGLLAWFCSHNIFGREGQLDFWCRERLNAYSQFIEGLLVSSHYGSPEKTAVAPLARLWRDEPAYTESIATILRRWLLVTWSEGQPEEKAQHTWHNTTLPVVAYQVQLRLTPIAMSIISQRPDDSLLLTIAQCIASAHLSTALHDSGKRHPTKWPHDTIITLLRWAYTEDAIPFVKGLVANQQVKEVKEALESLIPEALGIRKAAEVWTRPGPPSVEQAIRENADPQAYLPDSPRSWIHASECLAVRDDLPGISSDAQKEILDLFRACCDAGNNTTDRFLFEGLWPWVLKYSPAEFEKACAPVLCRALTSDSGPNYDSMYHFDTLLWQYESDSICRAIETCVKKGKVSLGRHVGGLLSEQLLECLLLHGTDEQIQDHLMATENLRAERGYLLISLMSTTELLRILKPACVVDLAESRCKDLCSATGWKDDTTTVERVEYWLTPCLSV